MRVIVYGSRNYARLVQDIAQTCGHECVGYIDDTVPSADNIVDYQTALRMYAPGSCGIVLGVGYRNLPARAQLIERVIQDGYQLPVLAHPRAYVHPSASLGAGAIVMAQAAVEIDAVIGPGAVLWTGTVVSHDSCVGANTFLSPGVVVCGHVDIGRDSFIGAGAILTDRCRVPSASFVKAGRVFTAGREA